MRYVIYKIEIFAEVNRTKIDTDFFKIRSCSNVLDYFDQRSYIDVPLPKTNLSIEQSF